MKTEKIVVICDHDFIFNSKPTELINTLTKIETNVIPKNYKSA